MEKVLVLGKTGMLGSMVTAYLQQTGTFNLWATAREGDMGDLKTVILDATASDSVIAEIIKAIQPQWIINCIGIIKPYCQDNDPIGVENAIIVNALFPHRLAHIAGQHGVRIIQIATDCVYSGREGKYNELAPHDALDVYGKTKSLGEVPADNVLHIRCSIIGPEVQVTEVPSLLEWFLRQPDSSPVPGFTHHQWNGVTTLQFAQLCQDIMASGGAFFDTLVKTSSVHHFIPNETVNKYELLSLCATVLNKPVTIKRVDSGGPAVDRSLATQFSMLAPLARQRGLTGALAELKTYIDAQQKSPAKV